MADRRYCSGEVKTRTDMLYFAFLNITKCNTKAFAGKYAWEVAEALVKLAGCPNFEGIDRDGLESQITYWNRIHPEVGLLM